MSSTVRHSLLVVVGLVTLVIAAPGLSAHDFWIVPNAFRLAAGATLEVRGQTSSRFPTTESAVVPERVAEARVISAAADVRVTALSVSEKSLLLTHKPAGSGQHVVAIALVARTSRNTPAGLKRYIALEGNTALAERYEKEGLFAGTDSVTQRAAKFAKTIVEVGTGGARAFSRVAGHPVEFVPLQDPARLTSGDTLAVRLLFRGKPLAQMELHAGAAPDSTAPADAKPSDVSVITDQAGVARIPLDRAGLWNVRSLHAAPAASASEWEVGFVTLVFSVGAYPDAGQGRRQ